MGVKVELSGGIRFHVSAQRVACGGARFGEERRELLGPAYAEVGVVGIAVGEAFGDVGFDVEVEFLGLFGTVFQDEFARQEQIAAQKAAECKQIHDEVQVKVQNATELMNSLDEEARALLEQEQAAAAAAAAAQQQAEAEAAASAADGNGGGSNDGGYSDNQGGGNDGGGGGSWGGGGGGSGEGGTKPKPHAKGDGQDTGEYNALILELPEKPMRTLTVDGEELPLTLELTRAEGFEVPETYSPTFTAELVTWAVEETAEEAHDSDEDEDEDEESREPLPDTLILKAVEEERLGDRFEYRWKFNGEVYRLLNNSGIRYLVLAVGEDMVTLPTEGFTGGTAYTKMKMQGVSTRKFDYTLSMSFNLDPDRIPMLSQYDFSEDCDIAIQTEVEGEKYVLSAEQKGEMYYYDVYVGSKEMMEVPYGTFGEATGVATAENGGNAHD